MKCFRKSFPSRLRLLAVAVFLAAIASTIAFGELPAWIRNIEASSSIEAAFFRMMSLPAGAVAFRRPPHETRPALGELIKTQPRNAELYSLRALEDEQELDFTSAESDWKASLDNSSDKSAAQLALADFYHRRLRPSDEIKTLSLIATAPPEVAEKLTPSSQQHSWRAFERIFTIIQVQGLTREVSTAQYRAWIKRYPAEPSLYARYLQFLVAEKDYSEAGKLISDYGKQFPDDQIFPLKAKAMVEYRRGSVEDGLSVYERSFQPLLDPRLAKSYFDLLRDTHNLRKFRDDAHAALVANPFDLNATARIFYYYQQQGKPEAAEHAIADLRLHKDAAKSVWTSQELFVCARLLEDIHAYPEAARYYFALYNTKDLPDAQQTAISGLAGILLTAPETPIRFGSGELSMYRDIATLDQGPGYLNGILSLILNTTQPASQYSQEEQRAEPYFHRGRAAELLALLDKKYPNAPRRAELHRQLLHFYSNAGKYDAVIKEGREFLNNFPKANERTAVSLLMADAFEWKEDSKDEFAIYDAVLQELATTAQNVPLGASDGDYASAARYSGATTEYANAVDDEEGAGEVDRAEDATRRNRLGASFEISSSNADEQKTGLRSPEYSRVLERYLARLAQTKQIPAALSVLRREIDRNPDDPGLYERLAQFLDQNPLGAQQEEIYRQAITRFSDKSWYDKLARFYLRRKRDAEFEQLTREAISALKGSDLEQYFGHVVGGSPALYMRLNQYANRRFPHNPVFVRNLLSAYQAPGTHDQAAWEALLRQHCFEDATLRNRLFEFLSSKGRLEGELNAIRQTSPDAASWQQNPAAAHFVAYAALWKSHFEESAPVLASLAHQYPADSEIANTASSVYRSLAYFEPAKTVVAAKIEDSLLQENPTDNEIMARIGDIYADHEQYALAAPYWERIPQVAPGQPGGYLEAATIYWDYYDFDNALRLLAKGRERLANPALYSYEAGAIYENQRDYPRAIAEYLKGALDTPGSSAESRLLQLARRPALREIVDRSTAAIAPTPNPSTPAVNLRVNILEAQNRKTEVESFLDSVATGTTSIELAEEIETLAQQKSLEIVRQHAIEKQAALTTDPVTRLELRYALIRIQESRKDFAAAQRNVESLYRDNPKILGVIRSTVDFYWRMKMQLQAISVLLQAAKDANPGLAKQFTYEAARKATESKQFQQARDLLAALLKDDPYNGEYLAATADTFAQSQDDRGLEQFYVEKIATLRNAALPSDARKAQVSTLRRGLIPALTRMKNYSGAVDQYIELINSFPEDDALVTEAALYALRYQRQRQLVDFYTKTVAQSPRDYRWSMVLARTQTNLEDYSAAIDTYGKAIAIRPDRLDLFTSRAELEERLMRFDDAASDYEHIYQLAYKDPQWMDKVATIRARQGKVPEVVAALQAALITGRPDSASNYFEVARRLEGWGMLDQARSFAEQGMAKSGSGLLAEAESHNGANIYVRIMTHMRCQADAFATLQKALNDSSANLPVLKEQLEKHGVGGLTDAQWRENVRRRMETARTGMAAALGEMGNTVNTYFTPEERLSFANFVESKKSAMSREDVEKFAIPLTVSAALAEQEARWRFESLMQSAAVPNQYLNSQPLVDLQRRRGRFAELGLQMEQVATAVQGQRRSAPLLAAADAYRTAGDEPSELRVLSTVFSLTSLDTNRQQRFFELQAKRKPDELVRIASAWPPASGEQAANYAVAHGSAALAHEVVQARSKARPPVWNKAYNALVGMYFGESTAQVNNAFLAALGDEPIGVRLSKPVDRDQRLAGSVWFYYGSRYGEYLGNSKQGTPEDFLPAVLEESPASASAYLTVADYNSAAGNNSGAIADYEHALEISPDQPAVYDDLALAYYKQGDRAAALAQWKKALTVLSKQLNGARVPDSFWRDFGRTCDQLRTRHLSAELKPETDAIVRDYLRHNGTWMSNAVLHSAYAGQAGATTATAWLLEISSSASDQAHVLSDVADASWTPLEQRAPIYQRVLELRESAVGRLDGIERQNAEQELIAWQVRWIQYLIRTKDYAKAAATIAALSQETRDAQSAALAPLELQAAAQLGTLDSFRAEYRARPQEAPSADVLRQAARQLFEAGDKQSARKILETVFAREIEEHQLVAANFLGLAEIRLASGDLPGAIDLLRRMSVAVGNPFENLDLAAALLEKTGRNAEAVEFLEQLVKSAPWEPSYRVRLAKAMLTLPADSASAADALASVASAPDAPYSVRLKAASAIAGKSYANLGSGELNLLASASPIAVADADKFYYYEARIRAVETVGDSHTKSKLLSHSIIDFPRRETARVPLFEVSMAGHSYSYGLGVLEPLLHAGFLRNNTLQPANAEAEIASGDNTDDDPIENVNDPNLAAVQLGRGEQARVAQLIGDAMMHEERIADALPYYQTARHLEPSPKEGATVLRKIAQAKSALREENENAARQPILHEALEQDRLVRRRLVALETATPKSSQRKGGVSR